MAIFAGWHMLYTHPNGHSKLETTQLYAESSTEMMRETEKSGE